VKSPEDAFKEFKSRYESYKKVNAGHTKVIGISFGYVMQSSAEGIGSLKPVYLFEGNDQIGNAKESFGPITIEAKRLVT
jgi:hypothetical protein